MTECDTYPPFGAKAERFLGIGYHPRLEVRSGTHRLTQIAPGCYNLDVPKKIVSQVPRWKRQEVTAEFSKRKGYVGDHLIKRDEWLKSINGPGWQEVPKASVGAISFPKAPRDQIPKSSSNFPGPGTYGKHHVPHTKIEEKSRGKGFSFSTLPSFEQYSKAPRSMTVHRSYHLPPNLYKLKDSTEEMLSKRISKRGPYDLFSGERLKDPVVPKLSVLVERMNPSDLSHPKNAFKEIKQLRRKTRSKEK